MENSSRLRDRMPGKWPESIGRAVKSGTVGGLSSAIVATLAGKREEGSYAAPLNATSHIIWGDKAAQQDNPSVKYTLTGFLLNYGSAIFWASFYEKLFGSRIVSTRRSLGSQESPGDAFHKSTSLAKPLLGAAAVTAGAYVIDYFLIPKRFTPGFEKRLSGKSLAVVLATLAVGIAARDMIDAAREHKRTPHK